MKVRLPATKGVEVTVESVQSLIAEGKDFEEISAYFGKDTEFIRRRLLTLAGITACDEMLQQISRNASAKKVRPVVFSMPVGVVKKPGVELPRPTIQTGRDSVMTVSNCRLPASSKKSTTLSDESRYVDKTYAANKKERDWLRAKIKDLRMHLDSANEAVSSSKAYLDELAKERGSLKDRIKRVEDNLWRLPHLISEAESEVAKATEALVERLSNAKREKLERKLADWEQKLAKYQTELENANAKLERLQIELAATIAEIDDSFETRERIKVQIEEMETTLKQFLERLEVLERPHFYIRRNEKGEVSLTCENIEKSDDPKLILRCSEMLHRYTVDKNITVSKSEFYVIVEFIACTIRMDETESVNIVRGNSTNNIMAIIKDLTQKK